MELLKKEILEQAELGFAVDIMEICKLYISPIGAVQSLTPEAESVTDFRTRIAVNEGLKQKLRGVTASVTEVVKSAPQISQIVNTVDGATDGRLRRRSARGSKERS